MDEKLEKFEFNLITPTEVVYSNEVVQAVIPGEEGYFGVLANHSPIISNLAPGIISLFDHRKEAFEELYVYGGFANFIDNKCTILAEEAVRVKDIDKDKVKEYVTELKRKLENERDEMIRHKLKQDIMMAKSKVEIMERIAGKK